MNLYLLSQHESKGWDTYDCIVVAAESEEEARKICPSGMYEWDNGWYYHSNGRTLYRSRSDWANDIANISVKLIGVADPAVGRGVILASFNAG
jgi:hypothetical protein